MPKLSEDDILNYDEKLHLILMDYVSDRLSEVIDGKIHVVYCAFDNDTKGVLINNLDDVVIYGSVKFVQKCNPQFGDGEDYESDFIVNPTWIDVAKLANDMIIKTGDYHNRILEGILEDEGMENVGFLMSAII